MDKKQNEQPQVKKVVLKGRMRDDSKARVRVSTGLMAGRRWDG